ncbi:MAG: insulinase family protein [Deltaproteobacteria bacterium]|nr:insulinase family protein [Deltaproteobacteria bacterium]MBW2152990.1 insulinase family protein [Deltaproteobacteria bacterium]
MKINRVFLFVGLLVAVTATLCMAQEPAYQFQLDIKEFFLENGMQFLVVERPTTPQVACRLSIRAGSALEDAGQTGIAHMLEHMMFKGTKNFGTLDPEKDEALQKQIEAAYQTILAEQRKREPNEALIKEKLARMEALRLEVQKIYVPQAFSSQLGKNGAVGVNAFTTKDQTQYMVSIPSDMLEQWFSIVSEQLFEPSWREFYVEKEVVQREWAFRYVNSPSGAAWLDLYATAYTAHPYRNPTIGWKSDMEDYSTESAIRFHTTYYNPTNAVCVLVGDVKLKEVIRLAKIYFERYPRGLRAPEKVTREPKQRGPRQSIRFLKGARAPLVRIGFHGAHMGSDDFYALDAMTMILSYGISARLDQNIVNKGLAVEAWAYNPDNRYGGMIIFGGSPNVPKAAGKEMMSENEKQQIYIDACKRFESVILKELERLKTEPISSRELNRIKKLNRRDFLERLRSNEALAGTLATLEVQVGWRYLMSYLRKMEEVTAEDIQLVAKKYIQTHNKTSVYIIPGGKPDRPPEKYTEVRSIGSRGAEHLVKPAVFKNNSIYETPPGWKHPLSFERKPKIIQYPKADRIQIENVPVFFLPDTELPFIDLSILLKAGSVDVPESKTGLTDILDQLLVQGGTRTYSPQELAMVLDENAIKVSVSIHEEDTQIHLSVLKSDWQKGLGLLKEILIHPRLDHAILKVIKQQIITALKRQAEDAQRVAMREAEIWRFKGHPYGRDPLLGIQTIPGISEADLRGFLGDYFVPKNMVIAIAGDIHKQEVVKGLTGFLKGFAQNEPPMRRLDTPAETAPVVALVHKPGQVQSQISLGLPSVKRTHPDYWKISLLVNVFGGDDSLLYKRLRDDLGLVYTAGFFQMYKWKAGMLVGYIGCRAQQTRRAIEETIGIMKSLHLEIPSKALELKRLDTLNSFVFNVDTPFQLVEVYGRYYLRREPLDTLHKIQEAYKNTSKDKLEALARKFLLPEKLQIFIVTDKTVKVKRNDSVITLEKDIKDLADRINIPFKEIELR